MANAVTNVAEGIDAQPRCHATASSARRQAWGIRSAAFSFDHPVDEDEQLRRHVKTDALTVLRISTILISQQAYPARSVRQSW